MKKNMRIISAFCIIVMLLVGCSSGNKQESSNSMKEDKEPEKVELSGKIEFFSKKQEIVQIFEEIIKNFNKEYPEIEVELVTVPDPNQVLLTRASTNELPDMFTDYPLNPEYRMFSKEGFNKDLSNEAFLKNVNEEILKMTDYEGKYYSLPLSLNFTGVYYHKDIFEELGLDIPTTYDEFINVLKVIKENGIQPLMVTDKDIWTLGAFADRAMGLIMEDKGELFEKVAAGEASCIDSEGLREVARQFLEMREYTQEDTIGTGYQQGMADFANKKAAMLYQGTWALPMMKAANPDVNVDMFPYPAQQAKDTKVGVNIDNAICISADTNNQELVKVFMEYMSRTEVAQLYADLDGSPSAIKGVVSKTEEIKRLDQYVSEGKSFRISRTYWKNGMIGDLNTNLQKLVIDKDIDQFLERMDESVKVYYK